MSLVKNLEGKKIGRLTVIKRSGSSKSGRAKWECICDCGNTKIVIGKYLINGDTKSCGCLHDNLAKQRIEKYNEQAEPFQNVINIVGNRYGRLTVIALDGLDEWSKSMWKCKCDCGNECIINRSSLIQGLTKSCGCLLSNGEENIQKILEQNNIIYKKQYTVDNLLSKSGFKLRFDFAIFNKDKTISHLLEYDGPQHYEEGSLYRTKKLIENDMLKNQYCVENNIRLLRIKYHDIKPENLTIEDLL